jgi:hypothetical protein
MAQVQVHNSTTATTMAFPPVLRAGWQAKVKRK